MRGIFVPPLPPRRINPHSHYNGPAPDDERKQSERQQGNRQVLRRNAGHNRGDDGHDKEDVAQPKLESVLMPSVQLLSSLTAALPFRPLNQFQEQADQPQGAMLLVLGSFRYAVYRSTQKPNEGRSA